MHRQPWSPPQRWVLRGAPLVHYQPVRILRFGLTTPIGNRGVTHLPRPQRRFSQRVTGRQNNRDTRRVDPLRYRSWKVSSLWPEHSTCSYLLGEHDPTIGDLLAAVPDLRKMDWINRFGEGSLVQLRAVQGCQRLCLIAGDISLPLEAIPPSLIVECFDVAHVLENETREALLRHIDR